MKECSRNRNEKYVRTFFNRWRQPVRVAENEWRLEANGTNYSWVKRGAVVTFQKTICSSGATVAGTCLGDPDRIEFDPITEASRPRF